MDDSPENLISLEATLEGLGQELVLARSGMQALRHLLDDDFAAVLLDVKMPDMDGFQTAELIRSRKRSRNTPILFLTGYKSDEQLFRGYDLGAVDFLFKPIVPEILRSKVRVFVDLSRNTALLQRQAEVLGKAEQKFRSLLEAAPDAMAVVDGEGNIVLVNAQVEKVFGYRRQDLLGRADRSSGPRASRGTFPTNRKFAPWGRGWNCTACAGMERRFPVEISLSPLDTEEGLLVTAAIRDVTARKKADQEIRELNASSRKARHRTHRGASRIQRSPAQIQRRSEPVRLRRQSRFAGASASCGAVQPDPPEKIRGPPRHPCRSIHFLRGERRAPHGIAADGPARLLAGRAHRARGPPGPWFARTHCAKRFSTCRPASIRTRPRSRGTAFLRCMPTKSVWCSSCRTWSATPSNTAATNGLEFTWTPSAATADWLFSVQDNGIGIKSEYAQQIFGIFKRLQGQNFPGTGIGLAICERIVQSYGGQIWVESTPGEGSTFYFTLPDRPEVS